MGDQFPIHRHSALSNSFPFSYLAPPNCSSPPSPCYLLKRNHNRMPHPKTPISPKQLAANRANAAKSTGPRTAPGKARSAQNARKHGFTASSFAVVRLEDLQEIAHLKEDLVALYQPVNSQELFALERMALAQQALLRAARLEAGLFTTCLNAACDCLGTPITLMSPELAGDGDIEITRAQNRNYLLGEGFQQMARKSSPLLPHGFVVRRRRCP